MRCCMRSVSGSRGRCTPGRSTSTACHSSVGGDPAYRAPGRLRSLRDDRDLLPDDAVQQRRLADVRAARERDEAAARGHLERVATIRSSSAQHLPGVRLVVVAQQVQHAVDRGPHEVVGVLGADHHVAELARPGGAAVAVDREREHVGWRVDAAVLAVEARGSRRADTTASATCPVDHADRASVSRPRAEAALALAGSTSGRGRSSVVDELRPHRPSTHQSSPARPRPPRRGYSS